MLDKKKITWNTVSSAERFALRYKLHFYLQIPPFSPGRCLDPISFVLAGKCGIIPINTKARFKRRATTVPNSIDRIKFEFSTAVERRLKPIRATRL